MNRAAYRCDNCNPLEAEAQNWWGFIRQNGSEFISDVTFAGVRIKHLGGGKFALSIA